MSEMFQLASAMVTLIFAAGMLITAQLYSEGRDAKAAISAKTTRSASRDSQELRTDLRLSRLPVSPVQQARLP